MSTITANTEATAPMIGPLTSVVNVHYDSYCNYT